MRVITDLKKRQWDILITVGTVKRVRRALDLDIYDIAKEGFLKAIIEDQIMLVDMFYVICQKQAEKEGVTDIEFGESFDGNHIDKAVAIFLEALVDFFPQSRRDAVRKALAKTLELAERTGEKIVESLDKVDIEKQADMVMGNMKPIP